VDDHIGQLAFEQADQLVREAVALVVGIGLERQAEDAHAPALERADPPVQAADQEQRHRFVDARDGERMPGGRSALRRRRSPCAGRSRL